VNVDVNVRGVQRPPVKRKQLKEQDVDTVDEYIVVNLVRPSSRHGSDGKMMYPWGLEVSKAAGLIGCPKGIAARSKKARDCIGLTIVKVGQTVVHNANDVTDAIRGRTSITLFFANPKAH